MCVKAICSDNVDTFQLPLSMKKMEKACAKTISLSFHNPFGESIQFVVLK